MASSMVAVPESILVDVDAGASAGTTTVHYVTNFHGLEAFVWERTVGKPFVLIDPLEDRLTKAPTGDPDEEGVFQKELQLGEVYQVLLFHHEDVDPNVVINDPPPDASTTAVALRKGPESEGLITFEEFGPTGTSFGWFVRTGVPTFAVLHVSKTAPVTDADGIPHLVTAIGTATSGFNDEHQLEVASHELLPGTAFHALLRVTDASGDWQFRHKPFVTKKRRVTVNLKQLRVINDGAQGNNRASFRIWVLQGNKLVSQCELPEREISDRPSPGFGSQEFIELAAECTTPVVLGPEVITGENQTLAILTRGIATVTIGVDDISGNFLPGEAPSTPGEFSGHVNQEAFFRFPIGSQRERVENRRFVVEALPMSDHEFEYTVEVRISVDYR